MYRVLLVDDEPLILSGIKFMIDWEALGCKVVATAPNGKLALETMETLRPDIVVADINMPVMDGIQLLEQAQQKYPSTVFVMLTNLEDFALVQDALRHRAIDYLIKTELSEESLTASIELAKQEVKKRAQYAQIDIVADFLEADRQEILTSAVTRFLSAGELTSQVLEVLEEHGFFKSYGVICLTIAELPGDSTAEDVKRLMGWLSETANELAGRSFQNYILLPEERNKINLVHWKMKEEKFEEAFRTFSEKLHSIGNTVLGVAPLCLGTQIFSGKEQREAMQKQLTELEDALYLAEGAETFFYYPNLPASNYKPLLLQGAAGQLLSMIHMGSVSGSVELLDKVIKKVEETPHRKSEIIWVCEELYQTAAELVEVEEDDFFSAAEQAAEELALLQTRKQAIAFLTRLRNELEAKLEPSSSGRLAVLSSAKEYINDNLHQKISLQEVADYARISPNYLSSLFKQEFSQNFVDYVNGSKMERAKELLEKDKYRVNEISYMLGFENAYYFSRVFRKHTGMSPTEYIKEYEAEKKL